MLGAGPGGRAGRTRRTHDTPPPDHATTHLWLLTDMKSPREQINLGRIVFVGISLAIGMLLIHSGLGAQSIAQPDGGQFGGNYFDIVQNCFLRVVCWPMTIIRWAATALGLFLGLKKFYTAARGNPRDWGLGLMFILLAGFLWSPAEWFSALGIGWMNENITHYFQCGASGSIQGCDPSY